MRTVLLKDSEWLRGMGPGTLLLDTDQVETGPEEWEGKEGLRCCIGVACKAFGVPDSAIESKGQLGEFYLSDIPEELRCLITQEEIDGVNYPEDTAAAESIYTVNDKEFDGSVSTDEERVSKINESLATIDAPFRFEYAPDK